MQSQTRRGGGRAEDAHHVSLFVKYTMFFINFLIWTVSVAMVGIGLWAFHDKYTMQGIVRVQSAFDVILDLSIVLMVVGGIIFIIGCTGCVGALRENTCLLNFYSLAVTLLLLGEIALAIVAFVFPDRVFEQAKVILSKEIIEKYRDDYNLQNLVDFVQKEFHCCGLSDRGYKDWNQNMYFNCSDTNVSVERCGVPFSCCQNSTNIFNDIVNMMCGFGAQSQQYNHARRVIFTDGCLAAIKESAQRNLHTIAGVALGVAIAQMFVVYLARNLQGQIELQKARWT